MTITQHGMKRMKQRGISSDALSLVEFLGVPVHKDSNGQWLVIPEKVISELMEVLPRCKNACFVTDISGGRLITAYHTEKKRPVRRETGWRRGMTESR